MTSHPVRLIVSVATALFVLFGAAPVAGADAPTRGPLDQPDLTFEDLCDFPVTIHATSNKEYLTIFSSGQILITGALTVRVTNDSTGKFVDLNIPGPIQVVPNANGTSTIISLGVALWPFTDPQPGLPPLALIDGRLEANSDPFTVTRVKGHVQDVCALLT